VSPIILNENTVHWFWEMMQSEIDRGARAVLRSVGNYRVEANPLPFDKALSECGAKPTETCKNEEGQVIRGVHPERWHKPSDRTTTHWLLVS
jgi:hypothetical protein